MRGWGWGWGGSPSGACLSPHLFIQLLNEAVPRLVHSTATEAGADAWVCMWLLFHIPRLKYEPVDANGSAALCTVHPLAQVQGVLTTAGINNREERQRIYLRVMDVPPYCRNLQRCQPFYRRKWINMEGHTGNSGAVVLSVEGKIHKSPVFFSLLFIANSC